METTYNIINNEQEKQFEIFTEGEKAILVYRMAGDKIALMHTEVPKAIEGKGIAGALAKHAFEYAAAHNYKVLVYCPYVTVFLKRHPEYLPQVARIHTEDDSEK